MTRTANRARVIAFAAGTALASISLAGCATKAAPRADLSAGKAEVALKAGKTGEAIANAEAAVLADPRNASYRTMLGAAYLEAGRFVAARTSFDDAMKLGDTTARTALGYALASVAAGDRGAAMRVLTDWQDEIPAADLGLAIALAGDPAQGVHVLSNAVRNGENTPKVRQNLAYALALSGNWAGARLMAAEDVPADQLDARIMEWASLARPEQSTTRVATLLGTRLADDPGQPAQLALANHPAHEQLAAEAAAAYAVPVAEASPAPSPVLAGGELPALAAPVPMAPLVAPAPTPTAAPVVAVVAPTVAAPEDFRTAFAEMAPAAATPVEMIAAAAAFISQPVVQQAPTRVAAAEPAASPRRNVARTGDVGTASGSHLVQLGSFSSEAGARRAWGIYAKRFPQLANFDMVISKAVVKGKTYYRVSAGGLQRAQANSVCSTVKAQGEGCYAWAEGRPMPGAVNSGVRFARR